MQRETMRRGIRGLTKPGALSRCLMLFRFKPCFVIPGWLKSAENSDPKYSKIRQPSSMLALDAE